MIVRHEREGVSGLPDRPRRAIPDRERNGANALVWQLSRLASDLPYREFQELRQVLDRAASVDVET
ncbi:hypothetical protein [Micromonospora sp. CB01531]|uniref:hypothetical protein n=1 Tax=Micromonospora sp. CB01531 TaxID=1718947 RepID=UPI001160F545|nr:hypothetical protein [Micromonospora sp. CB01531]